VPVAMPGRDQGPTGALRDLVEAVHGLYRAAGKPSMRMISQAVRKRTDIRETVSHQTISTMLNGTGLVGWDKVESIVKQLVVWAVDRRDVDAEIRRFHSLWLAASDANQLHEAPGQQSARKQKGRPYTTPPAGNPELAKLPRPDSDSSYLGRSYPVQSESLPIKNPNFTGRERILHAMRAALADGTTTMVALVGMGGVGKTQIAAEYAHRWVPHYDVVWWISADTPSLVRTALVALGDRLGSPSGQDMRLMARATIDLIERSALRMLLIFDNAEQVDEIRTLMPDRAGGHVIITSRDSSWTKAATTLKVDVFDRRESIDLLMATSTAVSIEEAGRLAATLGDLPLALSQYAAVQLATRMPAGEYLRLFESHVEGLLSIGKTALYPMTVGTLVQMALSGLRTSQPAAALLLEMFAFLGPDPISLSVLINGHRARVAQPLKRAFQDRSRLVNLVEELQRLGLIRSVDVHQRIQVHRLVRLALLDQLNESEKRRSRSNVHNVLSAANPGNPDDPVTWALHAEIGPHIGNADLVSGDLRARAVVLDQIRYLHVIGDYDGSRALGEHVVETWQSPANDGGLGCDHELTLRATRELAAACRLMGDYETSRRLTAGALDRLRDNSNFGGDHEFTLAMTNNLAADLRVTGDFNLALKTDRENVRRHQRVYGPEHDATLLAMNNLAVTLRLLGNFGEAFKIDDKVVKISTRDLGASDPRTLFRVSNLARDLYGLGEYHRALNLQLDALDEYRSRLGSSHTNVRLAERTIAIALRKVGRVAEALEVGRENYDALYRRLGVDHQHTLSSAMSFANTLCVAGEVQRAHILAEDVVNRYFRLLGPEHLLTLSASVNVAMILRVLGRLREARAIDERSFSSMTARIGAEHPFTLSAAVGLAHDLVLDRDYTAAQLLSWRTLELSRRVRSPNHPDTLTCIISAAVSRGLGGDPETASALFAEASAWSGVLVSSETVESLPNGRPYGLEFDIEPPPT
jgi:tetratricopeptide (TPR) repeat protein